MKLPDDLGTLTYCLNIHPTQTWAEARAAIAGPLAAVKRAVSPDRSFAAGLRFSAEVMDELAKPDARGDLAELLAGGDLDPVTMNGFPYGPFHGVQVKENVYLPDWRSNDRLDYTNALADLLAEVNPEGTFISLSTVPGAFRPLGQGAEAEMAANYVKSVSHCVDIERKTGQHIALAIEPEPCCFLETIAETATYFTTYLYGADAVDQLVALTGVARADAPALLRRHLGLCYDVCHAAVEFEDPAGSIALLRDADIPVHKLQLSSALRVPQGNPEARAALAAFNEPTYLHQLISRSADGTLRRFVDLPDALAEGGAADGDEWRVHFHVPLFIDTLPVFGTTQGFLSEILAIHRKTPISPHLEIETYTWDVLPPEMRTSSVEDAIARELRWVLAELGQ